VLSTFSASPIARRSTRALSGYDQGGSALTQRLAAPAEPVEIDGVRPFVCIAGAYYRHIGAGNALELEALVLNVVEQPFGITRSGLSVAMTSLPMSIHGSRCGVTPRTCQTERVIAPETSDPAAAWPWPRSSPARADRGIGRVTPQPNPQLSDPPMGPLQLRCGQPPSVLISRSCLQEDACSNAASRRGLPSRAPKA